MGSGVLRMTIQRKGLSGEGLTSMWTRKAGMWRKSPVRAVCWCSP